RHTRSLRDWSSDVCSSDLFLLRAFEKDFFAGFDPSRARFRTYLRTCLDRFVSNARKADTRLKRGGAVALVPIDFDEAERELRHQATSAIGVISEPAFDRLSAMFRHPNVSAKRLSSL